MAVKFPPGFKFHPTDEQLLNKYLRAKICGEQLPCDLIRDKDIYGPNANPWEIFNDPSTPWIISNSFEKVVYVFVRLTKISKESSSGSAGEEHYVKKAGCGTWHIETPRHSIMKGKKLIGNKRMLVFQINDINGLGDGFDVDKVGYWKMHEYFLHGCKDYVVCRITFDTSKRAKVDPPSKAKAVSGTPAGSTKSSKANKKVASISTTKDDKEKAVLIESSRIYRDLEKELAPNQNNGMMIYQNDLQASTSSINCYGSDQGLMLNKGLPQYDDRGSFRVEEQGGQGSALNNDQRLYYEEEAKAVSGTPNQNNGMMMIYQNELLASTNSISRYGSYQGLMLNKGLPQYDDGGSFRVEEQEDQGLALNNDQRLDYEEEAQPVIPMSGDFENQGIVISEFNDDGVFLDLSDLLDSGSSWSDINNGLQEQSTSKDDVSLNIEDFFDIGGSWSEKNMEKFHGQVNNNVQEQQQQHMQNMSCMLGKRQSSEAQEDYSGPTKKSCI